MSRDFLDPKKEQLIAFLYGELSESEARSFRERLEQDEELRREYDELRAVRSTLGGWEVEQRVPSFVMMDEPESGVTGLFARLREALGKFGGGPVWALGTAALFLVMMTLGLRIERLDGGFAVRFASGENDTIASVPASQAPAIGATARPIEYGRGAVQTAGSDADPYLSREEFQAYSSDLMWSVVSLLDDYGSRRDAEISEVVQAVYSRVSDQQSQDYRELRQRIEGLGGGARARPLVDRKPIEPAPRDLVPADVTEDE